jgi:hydroxyacylglutathione hydrolase
MIKITPIQLSLPYNMGSVNCHLLQAGDNFLLIDTGSRNSRKALESELAAAGCYPTGLKLIILTHGDFDHSGNAAHLHDSFGVPLAMHAVDSGMVARGNMFVNRKQPSWLIRKLMPLATGFGRRERFIPDILVSDGDELSKYGFKAKVLSIPGHSLGSIGILTKAGDLFCGDLFENLGEPKLNTIMDDPAAAESSLAVLGNMKVRMVYPGHGEPFELGHLIHSA